MSMGGKRLNAPKEVENILRLPSHISLEILSRLPVKTIIHCSSVCKAWRSLILDPCFPHIHLAKSSISLMLRSSRSYRLIEFGQDISKWKMSEFKDECVLAGEPTSAVCSCNGLICLKAVIEEDEFEQYYVWNPVKNDNIFLPMPNLEYTDKDCFGYCPRTNVYKVIRMVTYGDMGSSNTAMCEVYTLGTNAWRIIQDVPGPDDEYDEVNSIWKVSFNGAVHWFCSSNINDKNFPIWICAFRIEDEKWDPIFLPLPLLEVPHSKFNYLVFELGVLKNCLSIFDKLEDSLLDVWMMKDYGVTESWTKCWSIESHMPCELHVPSLLPLKLTNEGDLLMFDMLNEALVCFNTKKGVITHKQRIDGVPRGHRGIAYVASFISPTEVINKG